MAGAAVFAIEEVLHGINGIAFFDTKDLGMAEFAAIPDSMLFM